jgi:uncharacterized protein
VADRERYPAGVPCWVDTAQPDPEAAMAFYGGLFGWTFDDLMPEETPGRYLVAHLDGRDVAAIGWAPEEQDGRSPAWSTYVAVDNADRTAIAVVEAGGDVLVPAADIGDAGRMAVMADPTGAVFCIWQAIDFFGAEAVNEPGTWNWSILTTRDPHAAVAFYNAVFGWEATDPGDDQPALVRLPGYGDFLATLDPTLRERHAAAGVPPGFSDAVAWVVPLTDDGDPYPTYSHWSVVFAVGDAYMAEARVEALGGKVIEPARALGPAVQALVEDPAGARFTLSAYSPEAV